MELPYKDTTYKIRRACFNVYNTLGYGHKEAVYQNSLAKELELLKIPYEKEKSLRVYYKDQQVGYYIPDFIIDKKIILEVKATTFTLEEFEEQIIHYLKNTGLKLGILVNFGTPALKIKRLIWSKSA